MIDGGLGVHESRKGPSKHVNGIKLHSGWCYGKTAYRQFPTHSGNADSSGTRAMGARRRLFRYGAQRISQPHHLDAQDKLSIATEEKRGSR